MSKTDMAEDLNLAAQTDPTESTVEFYEAHAREYIERTVSADLSPIYDEFSKRVHRGRRVLDAGCGSGRDLKNLHSRGFNVVGIDASAALVALARQYSGEECFTMRLEDVSFRNRFDAVWACASLLHVPKGKIVAVLEWLRRSLVKGGVLFASVQLGEGEMLAPDGRFFAYYTHDEIGAVLQSAGFSMDHSWISEDTLPSRRPLRWLNVFAHDSSA